MVAQYYGIKLSHSAAIELADCKPDGATLLSVAKSLKKSHGLCHRTLRKQSEVREALMRGEPVMSHDALTYENDHAILVIGATAKGFWIADPLLGEVYWRHERAFFAAADDYIAVIGMKEDPAKAGKTDKAKSSR
jgi:ABC-type bacteriocin/lantibiotic exporter with double-glycine peptidase domain